MMNQFGLRNHQWVETAHSKFHIQLVVDCLPLGDREALEAQYLEYIRGSQEMVFPLTCMIIINRDSCFQQSIKPHYFLLTPRYNLSVEIYNGRVETKEYYHFLLFLLHNICKLFICVAGGTGPINRHLSKKFTIKKLPKQMLL